MVVRYFVEHTYTHYPHLQYKTMVKARNMLQELKSYSTVPERNSYV